MGLPHLPPLRLQGGNVSLLQAQVQSLSACCKHVAIVFPAHGTLAMLSLLVFKVCQSTLV